MFLDSRFSTLCGHALVISMLYSCYGNLRYRRYDSGYSYRGENNSQQGRIVPRKNNVVMFEVYSTVAYHACVFRGVVFLFNIVITARGPKVWPLLIFSHSFVQI